LQWSGIALEVRDLLACDAFEHEVHGGFDEGARTIDGTAYLRRRPAPVDSKLVAGNRDCDLQRQWLRMLAKTVEITGEVPGALRQRSNLRPHHPRGIVVEPVEDVPEADAAVTFDEVLERLLRGEAGGHLGAHVAGELFRHARVERQHLEQGLVR